jgi:hypothetical protein
MKLLEALKFVAALALAALLLAGCEKNEGSGAPMAASRDSQAMALSADSATPQTNGTRHIELTYAFTLSAPEKDVAALQQKHLTECRRLGCEVLSTSLDRFMRDSISAKVSIRIAPEKFPEFEQAISAPPVEVSYRNESAVDQTLPLIDAEKRLEVKILLRDRLTAMLREPGQKSPADMAEIERKIAEVQGEIESATARRDYLRTVTQTVRVDISYYSVSAKVSGVNFSPVAAAVRGAARTFTNSVAALIVFLVWIVPWLPFAALVFWIVRWLRRRGRHA